MLARRSGASEVDPVAAPPSAAGQGRPLDSEALAREFLGTLPNTRSPFVPAFTAWCAANGLTVRDSKPVLAAVLRARVADATMRFRNRTARAR